MQNIENQSSSFQPRGKYDRNVEDISKLFGLRADEVSRAYQNKPGELSMVFNAVNELGRQQSAYICASLVFIALFPPLGLLSGYGAYRNYIELGKLRRQVNERVASSQLENHGKKPAALPKPQALTGN